MIRKYVSRSVIISNGLSGKRSPFTLMSRSYLIFSTARSVEDKGDIVRKATTLTIQASMSGQLLFRPALILKAFPSMFHHGLGTARRVLEAGKCIASSLASRAKGSVLFKSSKSINVSCVQRTAMRVGRNRHPRRAFSSAARP